MNSCRMFLIVLLLILPMVSFSQVELYNSILKDSTSRILIKNLDNIIVVKGITDYNKFLLESTSSEITQSILEENIFRLRIYSLTSEFDTLRAWYDGNLKGEFIFKISHVSKIEAYIDGLDGTIVSVNDILSLKNPQLKAKFPEHDLNIGLRIFEFKTLFLNNNSDTMAVVQAALNNSYLTQEHLFIIEQLNPGYQVIFEPVAVASGVASSRLPPLKLTIR